MSKNIVLLSGSPRKGGNTDMLAAAFIEGAQAAGKNIANPLATILSAAMMFEYAFELKEEAELIRQAVDASMNAGVVTEDISLKEGKVHSTSQVGDWIVNYIKG